MRFLPKQSKQVDCAPFGMHVLLAAIVMVGIASTASAQTCTCADAGFDAGSDAPLSVADAEAFELLQAQLDAQPHSSLPTAAAAAPAEPEDLPWCTGQNVAQCSKLPSGSTPSPVSLGVSPSLMISTLLDLPSPSNFACDYAEHSCGGPRDAVRSKQERPPQ